MFRFEWRLLGREFHALVSARAEGLLRRLFAFPELADALVSPWRIELTQTSDPVPNLPDAYTAAIHGGTVRVSLLSDGCWVSSGDAGVRLNAQGSRAQLTLYGADDDLAPCLMVAGIEALRLSGLVPLHAAMAAHDAGAVAFTGPSGAGKTTTLLHALRSGWRPVCEDFAWLEPVSMTVFGADRGLRLLPDTLRWLHEVFPHVQPGALEGGKTLVEFADLAPRVWQAPLKAMWKLERRPGDKTHFELLSPSERLMTLFEASGLPVSKLGQALFAAQAPQITARLEVRRAVMSTGLEPLSDLFGAPLFASDLSNERL